MNAIVRFWNKLRYQSIDPASLQFRLTLGIASVSLLGFGGLAMWTSWKMQHLVYETYDANLALVAARLSQALANAPTAPNPIQAMVDECATRDIWIWVEDDTGEIIAHSRNAPERSLQENLAAMPSASPVPQIDRVGDRQIMWRSQPIAVEGEVNQFYIAKDVTSDYEMMASLTRSLGVGTVLAVISLISTGAILVWRSLSPLRQTNQLAHNQAASSQARFDPAQVPSEMKDLVQTWNRLQDRLVKTGEQQRQFTSGVSHELRTPLSVVYGYLQSTLKRGTNLTPQQQEALQICASETERTIQLLQNLLDLARAEHGAVKFDLKPLSLHEVIQEVASMMNQWQHRSLLVEADSPPLIIRVDRYYLIQVLVHLLTNAAQFSDAHESVTLRLKREETAVVVHVCDRGVGIAPEHQAHIFEPFYRVDPSRTRATGGIGLGLAITKALVEGMGGQIAVNSALGKGSTFSVTFADAREIVSTPLLGAAIDRATHN